MDILLRVSLIAYFAGSALMLVSHWDGLQDWHHRRHDSITVRILAALFLLAVLPVLAVCCGCGLRADYLGRKRDA